MAKDMVAMLSWIKVYTCSTVGLNNATSQSIAPYLVGVILSLDIQ